MRIREELRNGMTPQAALHSGYERAWATILDSNVTTLIAGIALFAFGSGPVRGFAVVHCLGIMTSMFSAVMVSRGIVNLYYGGRSQAGPDFHRPDLETRGAGQVGATMEIFRFKRSIPFMRYALIFNVISLITFLIAVGALATKGLHLGVDFTGGTVIEVNYPQPPDLNPIRDRMIKIGFADPSVQNFGTARDVLIRLPVKEGITSAQLSEQVMTELRQLDAAVKLQRVEFVGPQVGKELLENGALALLFVSLGIVGYLWLRFEWKFGVSAIIVQPA